MSVLLNHLQETVLLIQFIQVIIQGLPISRKHHRRCAPRWAFKVIEPALHLYSARLVWARAVLQRQAADHVVYTRSTTQTPIDRPPTYSQHLVRAEFGVTGRGRSSVGLSC